MLFIQRQLSVINFDQFVNRNMEAASLLSINDKNYMLANHSA